MGPPDEAKPSSEGPKTTQIQLTPEAANKLREAGVDPGIVRVFNRRISELMERHPHLQEIGLEDLQPTDLAKLPDADAAALRSAKHFFDLAMGRPAKPLYMP